MRTCCTNERVRRDRGAASRQGDRPGTARRGCRRSGSNPGLLRSRCLMLLELRGIESGYGKMRVLHGVDLGVARGSVTALVGANGAGKTTLMRTVAGLLPVV